MVGTQLPRPESMETVNYSIARTKLRHLKSQNSSVSLDFCRSRNRAITSVCCVTFTS
ncbi:unnamed protein product, partial [Musa banksii]